MPLLVCCIAVVVVVLGCAALAGKLPGVPLRAGPLEGPDGVTTSIPVRPTDAGVLWGILTLDNRTGSPVVVDSVEVADNPDGVALLTEPYIWDDTRVAMLGTGSVDVYHLPLPADWRLPARHPVHGYIIEAGTPEAATDAEDNDRNDPSAEVLFEFAAPRKAATISGITVRYHIGWMAYRRTFDTTIVMCPLNDRGPCDAIGD